MQIAVGADFGAALVFPGSKGLVHAWANAKAAAQKWISRVFKRLYNPVARGATEGVPDTTLAPINAMLAQQKSRMGGSEPASLDDLLSSLAEDAGLTDLLASLGTHD